MSLSVSLSPLLLLLSMMLLTAASPTPNVSVCYTPLLKRLEVDGVQEKSVLASIASNTIDADLYKRVAGPPAWRREDDSHFYERSYPTRENNAIDVDLYKRLAAARPPAWRREEDSDLSERGAPNHDWRRSEEEENVRRMDRVSEASRRATDLVK